MNEESAERCNEVSCRSYTGRCECARCFGTNKDDMGSFLNDIGICFAGCVSGDTLENGVAGGFLIDVLPDCLGGVVTVVLGGMYPGVGREFWEVRFEDSRDTDGGGRGVVGELLDGGLVALGPAIGRL